MILLRDKKRCPNCRARRPFTDGYCANCGLRLFIRPINFQQFEDDGNPRRYWLWTNSEGWIFRDHVMMGLQPLSAEVNLTTPERVTKTAEERMAEERARTDLAIRRSLPKRNQFGRGKSITSISGH